MATVERELSGGVGVDVLRRVHVIRVVRDLEATFQGPNGNLWEIPMYQQYVSMYRILIKNNDSNEI